MKKSLWLMLSVMMVLTLILSACAAPTEEAPAEEAPAAEVTEEVAVGWAKNILGSLEVVAAVDAAATYLDAVATDVSNADGVRTSYISTTNYVDGGSEPDIKTYLASGDALLNTVAVGGEGAARSMDAGGGRTASAGTAMTGAGVPSHPASSTDRDRRPR